jgi:hypothetical protein
MANEHYNIFLKDELLHHNISEEEYFDLMENLSINYYQTGSPKPEDLRTEILLEN